MSMPNAAMRYAPEFQVRINDRVGAGRIAGFDHECELSDRVGRCRSCGAVYRE